VLTAETVLLVVVGLTFARPRFIEDELPSAQDSRAASSSPERM
jgi:hypothetical protein